MPDIIPGLTDRFLLSDTDAQWIKNELNLWDANIKKRSIKIKIAYKDLLLKRLKDPGVSQGKYDEFAGKIPCYCGWNYARLRANGDLNTCLKSHRMPMGNMYQSDFISCWNGSSWQEFREKSLAFPKDKEFFKLIGNDDGDDAGCSRSCDNFLVNNSTNKIARFFISAPRHKSQ